MDSLTERIEQNLKAEQKLTAVEVTALTKEVMFNKSIKKAVEMLELIYADIRAAIEIPRTNINWDLFNNGGLKGLPYADTCKQLVKDELTANGYSITENNWSFYISWGD